MSEEVPKVTPLEKKRPRCIGKGGAFEWTTAREISKWLTAGQDDSQLVRSVLSGGNERLRSTANSRPEYQVGDLAPNGPEGEVFRRVFGVECKNYGNDPDWNHALTYSDTWMVEGWWTKLKKECEPHKLEPLLIMRRNRTPTVVMMRERLWNMHSAPLWRGNMMPDLTIHRLSAVVLTQKKFFTDAPELWIGSVTDLRA